MLAVATIWPAGWTPPRLFSQIMISDPFGWPEVDGVEFVQMS